MLNQHSHVTYTEKSVFNSVTVRKLLQQVGGHKKSFLSWQFYPPTYLVKHEGRRNEEEGIVQTRKGSH